MESAASLCYIALWRMRPSIRKSPLFATLLRATGARRRRGRILAVKWGLNPNSSSLGADVTFLLLGAAALSLFTPVLSALIRLRSPAADDVDAPDTSSD